MPATAIKTRNLRISSIRSIIAKARRPPTSAMTGRHGQRMPACAPLLLATERSEVPAATMPTLSAVRSATPPR